MCVIRLMVKQMFVYVLMLVQVCCFEEVWLIIVVFQVVFGFVMEIYFLFGYVVVEIGDLRIVVIQFCVVFVIDLKQICVWLEFVCVLMLEGKDGSVSYYFCFVVQDEVISFEICVMIQVQCSVLCDCKLWYVLFDFGIVFDSNIINGMMVEIVDLVVGNQMILLMFDFNVCVWLGLGQIGSILAGWCFKVGECGVFLIDGDIQVVNYDGMVNDDYMVQIVVGFEFCLSEVMLILFQGVGL